MNRVLSVASERPINRRSGEKNLEAYLERGLRDSGDISNFPLQGRRRDCEPWNQFVHELNAAHESGSAERLEEARRKIGRVLMLQCGE